MSLYCRLLFAVSFLIANSIWRISCFCKFFNSKFASPVGGCFLKIPSSWPNSVTHLKSSLAYVFLFFRRGTRSQQTESHSFKSHRDVFRASYFDKIMVSIFEFFEQLLLKFYDLVTKFSIYRANLTKAASRGDFCTLKWVNCLPRIVSF